MGSIYNYTALESKRLQQNIKEGAHWYNVGTKLIKVKGGKFEKEGIKEGSILKKTTD